MKYPKKLQPGDTIGLVCPSSAISRERETAVVKNLESMGYKVKKADNLTTNYAGYMADEGEVRGQWINKMFADPEVDAVICVRGGDGGSRAMEYVDLEIIKNNPKIFVGYSDITSLHIAITQNCDLVTFHGPMASSNMVDHFDEETKASFYEAINADGAYELKNPEGKPVGVMKEGKATGQLIGGNLALLSACMGTPYEIDTKGKILFIEEVGESMSRIDRFAYQLRNAGKFKDCAGVILGQFTDCKNDDNPSYMELHCFKDILKGLDIPVMYNVQSGHDYPMVTLPFGATCTVDTTDKSIRFAAPDRK